MRLKTSIFLYVCLAALLPLAVLALIATTYSEERYQERVEQEIYAGLESVVAGLERRLLIERDILRGLSNISAIRALHPVLSAQTNADDDLPQRIDAINQFLQTFQGVRTSLDTVRVLDAQGRAVVRVTQSDRAATVATAGNGLPLVEPYTDERLQRDLRDLRAQEPGTILLPHNRDGGHSGRFISVYSMATALEHEGEEVGYLTINPPLRSLDQILNVAPRVQNGQLLIAEINIADPRRNGQILYDDAELVLLSDSHMRMLNLAFHSKALLTAAFHNNSGTVAGPKPDSQIYYRVFFPYPDRLISWVVAITVDSGEIGGPFQSIRVGIYASMLGALLLSLMLAQYGVRMVVHPVRRLTEGLIDYASGRRDRRIDPTGPQEVRVAGRAFNDMADAIESAERERDEAQLAIYRSAKLASLGQMAAGIGHEISNPLNNILSLTTLMQRELPEGNRHLHADLQSVREETERAARTVKAILSFSSQIGGEVSHFGIATWVRDTLDLALLDTGRDDVVVDVQLDEDCQLQGDRNLLQHALRNLLVNAIQVSAQEGMVHVLARCEQGYLHVQVRDHGEGVPQENRDKVFDPFFTTKPEGKGSGLGLSISLGVTQYHGGTLELDNHPDGGAVASLSLPLEAVRA